MPPPQKKYICGFCSRAFTRSEHKQRHERSHTNEKPFHCLYCTSAFVRRDLLQRHCRTVHNIRLVSRSHYKDDRNDTKGLALVPVPLTRDDDSHVMASAKALLQLAPQDRRESEEGSVTSNGSGSGSPGITSEHAGENGQSPKYENSSYLEEKIPIRNMAGRGSAGSGTIPVSSLSPNLGSASLSQSSSGIGSMGSTSPNTAGPIETSKLLALCANIAIMSDAEDARYPLSDMFVVGYTVLLHEPVFPDIQQDFVDSIMFKTHSDFQVGLLYTVLAVGALTLPGKEYRSEDVATAFINKAWNILVERLIPKHMSLHLQASILRNLYVLTHVYLRFFNNNLMVLYLEDSAYIILQNVLQAPPAVANDILHQHSRLFWCIYVLVSQHGPGEGPPKFYKWFFDLIVPGVVVPSDNNGCKTGSPGLAQNLHNGHNLPHSLHTHTYSNLQSLALREFMLHTPTDHLGADIYACTLINELAYIDINGVTAVFELRAHLHSAIMRGSNMCPVLLASTFYDVFSVLHQQLLHSSFSDLLEQIHPITQSHQWIVLGAALREYNSGFHIEHFVADNVHSLFQTFGTALLNFMVSSNRSDDTNVGIVLYPLVLQHTLLKMRHVPPPLDPGTLPLVEVTQCINVVMEWYITVVKMLVDSLRKSPNRVLQCIMHMLGISTNTPELPLSVLNDLTRVYDTWLSFLGRVPHLTTIRLHMTRFFNDVVVLALNNDNFNVEDLQVTNESVLLRNRRSKSISAIETGNPCESILTAPPVFSHAPLPTLPNNYVLMNETVLSAPLPPLNMNNGNLTALTARTGKFPFPVLPVTGTFVLPPIHAPRD